MPSTAKRSDDSGVRLCSAERQFLENFVRIGKNLPRPRPNRNICRLFFARRDQRALAGPVKPGPTFCKM